MSPRREGPLTRQIRVQSRGEQGQTQYKPSPNGTKLCSRGPYTPRGPQNKHWAGMAPLGHPWSAHTPMGTSRAQLSRTASYRVSNDSCMGLVSNLNAQEGGLLKLWGEPGNIPGILPSSPPIKGGQPSLLKEHTKGEEHTTLEQEHHYKGLRPQIAS
jgi:hypothetical protein